MSVEELEAPEETDKSRMTLREHIIELRNRLLISVLAIVVGTVVGWLIYNQAFHLLTAPFKSSVRQLDPTGKPPELILGGVGDALTFRIKISALFGLLLAGLALPALTTATNARAVILA